MVTIIVMWSVVLKYKLYTINPQYDWKRTTVAQGRSKGKTTKTITLDLKKILKEKLLDKKFHIQLELIKHYRKLILSQKKKNLVGSVMKFISLIYDFVSKTYQKLK